MRFIPRFTLAVALTLTGCHSAYIEATISNHTPEPLTLVELDYPSASFGTQNLAPGADFHYRFKILGSGPTTLLWTDSAHHDHKASGPSFHENDEGTLTVTITPTDPTWNYQPLHLR
jgi:hypothetical protein